MSTSPAPALAGISLSSVMPTIDAVDVRKLPARLVDAMEIRVAHEHEPRRRQRRRVDPRLERRQIRIVEAELLVLLLMEARPAAGAGLLGLARWPSRGRCSVGGTGAGNAPAGRCTADSDPRAPAGTADWARPSCSAPRSRSALRSAGRGREPSAPAAGRTATGPGLLATSSQK